MTAELENSRKLRATKSEDSSDSKRQSCAFILGTQNPGAALQDLFPNVQTLPLTC